MFAEWVLLIRHRFVYGGIKMAYIEFDSTRPLDLIPIGRIAIDFNPTDMNKP